MHPYLDELARSSIVFVDTETTDQGDLWSLQFSVRPGSAAFVLHTQTQLLNFIANQVARTDMLTVMHNCPFDLPVLKSVGIIPYRAVDTMTMAYLLQSEPQGLKPLSYRHAGMKMQSFTDVTAEATRLKSLLYLATAVEMEWPDPAPVREWQTKGPKAGTYHTRQPQNIAKKIAGILRDSTTAAVDKNLRRLIGAGDGADPFKRWTEMAPEDGRGMVEEKLGPLNRAYLSDIPLDDAVYYASRDPDATARVYYSLWPQIQALDLEEAFWSDMKAMEICLDMMEVGIEVDVSYLRSLSQFFKERLDQISSEITSLTGKVINPRSYQEVSDLLFRDLKIRTIKPFNKDGYHPTGDEILAQLVTEHPVVQKIRDYREYAKYRSTYTEKIPEQVDEDGRVHATVNMTRTSTGRLCVDPNTLIEAPRDMEKYPHGIPLHQLKSGDYVYSFDHRRELCVKKVKWVGPTKVCPTLKIRYKADGGPMKELICSDDHLIRLFRGEWVHAYHLKLGSRLLCMPTRHNHRVQSIVPGPTMQLWDLEVEDTHCFIGNEVALHNSYKNPNLQNIPVRKDDARKIRRGFVAQKGCKIIAIDKSQIELRLFAHYSQDPELLDVYRNDGDIHTKTGCHTFNMTPEELPEYPERRSAKTTNFGVAYEITARGLYEQLIKDGVTGWTVDDCQGFIDSWLGLYSGVIDYRKKTHGYARQHGYVRDISNRIRYVPGVRCRSPYLVAEALRQAGNMPIQGSAAYILKRAMALLPPIYNHYRAKGYIFNPLIQVHDELLFEIQDEIIDEVVPMIKSLMENAVKLSVPIRDDVEIGDNWGELTHWEAGHA